MSHLSLPEQWSVAGVDLSTFAYQVRSVTGVDEFPPLRGEDDQVPGLTGRRYRGKVWDATRKALAIYVAPVDASGALVEPTSARQARKNLDALYALLTPRRQVALVRTMPDASTRTAAAELIDLGTIEDQYGHELIGLVADFALADPWFYGAQAVDAARSIPASPTTFTLTNAGSAPTSGILLDFAGPITSPRVANLTIDPAGGFYVEALVTVAGGTHLLIDCAAFTALNGGANAIGSLNHSGAKEFLRLDPGANSIRVTAATPGGTLTTTFSPPFV